MRDIILYIATRLDGYIARPDGGVDWLFSDGQDYGYRDFYAAVDAILMGRTTYEQVLTFGDFPDPDRQCFVFSQSLEAGPRPHVTVINEEPSPFMSALKQSPGSRSGL